MIVFGRVVPLEKAAKMNFEGIPEEAIDQKIRADETHNDQVKCFDPGFGYMKDEYILGYNPLIQVSNFRAIVDSMKDLAVFICLIIFLNGNLHLYFIGVPLITNNLLMITDIMSLKKHGHAEFIDVLSALICVAVQVDPQSNL
jgi:hypothetical protein